MLFHIQEWNVIFEASIQFVEGKDTDRNFKQLFAGAIQFRNGTEKEEVLQEIQEREEV